MGHRANFVIIRKGAASASEDQWAALGCLAMFSAGPDDAVEQLSECEPTTELLDWAFAEGGYLIDFDRQVAIVFGPPLDEGEFDFDETDFDAAELPEFAADHIQEFDPQTYLEEIAPAWSGWKLIYDERGVDAFAAHLKSWNIAGIHCQPVSHPPTVGPPCEWQA